MKELAWDKTLSIDVPEIDDDHRRLIDTFNLLNRAVSQGESPDYVTALMEELISCTVWHFRHEERLMLRHGYPELPEHKAEHEDLIAGVRDLQQRLTAAGGTPSSEDIEFLEHWLTGHIYGADMGMGGYLAERI